MLTLTKYAHVYIKKGLIVTDDNPFNHSADCHLKNFVISKDKKTIRGDMYSWSWWIDSAVLTSPYFDEVDPEWMETVEKRKFFFFKYKVTQPKKYYIKKNIMSEKIVVNQYR